MTECKGITAFNRMEKDDLIKHLNENADVLRNPSLRKAFEAVDRADFVGEDYVPEAYEDYALPLGDSETITKPTIVAFMLELLDIKQGDKVLEVGSGSGWVLALMSEMAGKEGSVTGVEIVPELVERGRRNIAKYAAHAVVVPAKEGEVGHAAKAPYDKILCTPTAYEIPRALIDQLKANGTIVMPVEGRIVRGLKKRGKLVEEVFPGTFSFEQLRR